MGYFLAIALKKERKITGGLRIGIESSRTRLVKMQAVVDAARELDKSRGTSPDVVGENEHGDSLSAEGMAAVKFHKALASLDQDK